jgi:hypothetical protein
MCRKFGAGPEHSWRVGCCKDQGQVIAEALLVQHPILIIESAESEVEKNNVC